MKVVINDILGKVEDGILVLIDIEHEDKYYEGTYWYNSLTHIFTASDDLEAIVDVKNHKDYDSMLDYLKLNLEPYYEIISKLEELEFDYEAYSEYYKNKYESKKI